jgi:hypothetical protein
MARCLTIRLHDGGKVVVQTDAPEEAIPFDGLAELMYLPLEEAESGCCDAELVPPDAMPEGRLVLRDQSLTEIAYAPDWSRVLISGWKKRPRRPHYYNCCVWQAALICACMNALLRDMKALPVHGAVLETDRGALLLFGESGMGKSTAFARWRSGGGIGYSDDMALMDFSGKDGLIRVRRLPTWSACREGRNEWCYPCGEELPLACVLALGRSETGDDELAVLSPVQFFAQCYRSMFYWILFYAKSLPGEMQTRLADAVRQMTERVTAQYPPRALLTSLTGMRLAELVGSAVSDVRGVFP